MLARIVPGVIAPTAGTPTLMETVSGTEISDLVNYGTRITCTVTASVAPPFPSFGWRAYVSRGPTTAANLTAASSFVSVGVGTNVLTFDLSESNRVKNNYYKVVVVYTDTFGNTLYEVASSSAVQLTTLRWYRTRGRGTGTFTFDTTKGKCDFIVVSGGAVSNTPDGSLGSGGFGVAYKNITPPSGTFYYDLVRASGTNVYVRRDSGVSTANEIFGTNATNYPSTTAGQYTSLTGVFTTPTYASNGASLNVNSGARVNSDFLQFSSYYDPLLDNTFPLYYGDGMIVKDFTDLDPGFNEFGPGDCTYQILYYE